MDKNSNNSKMDSNSNTTMKRIIHKTDNDIPTDIRGDRHPFYSQLIKDHQAEYQKKDTTTKRKTDIINNVKKACEKNNCRFYYQEDGTYYQQQEVTKIREKIKKALGYKKNKNKNKKTSSNEMASSADTISSTNNSSTLLAKKTKMAASGLIILSKGGTRDNSELIGEEGEEREVEGREELNVEAGKKEEQKEEQKEDAMKEYENKEEDNLISQEDILIDDNETMQSHESGTVDVNEEESKEENETPLKRCASQQKRPNESFNASSIEVTPLKDCGRQKRRKQGDNSESNVSKEENETVKGSGAVAVSNESMCKRKKEEEVKVILKRNKDDGTYNIVLPPIKAPSSDPQLPDNKWSFDKTSRVLLVKFNGDVTIKDEMFLLKMMERDDITVVSEGLIDEIDKNVFTFKAINNEAGILEHNKFHLFEKIKQGIYSEIDGDYVMTISDYINYLENRNKNYVLRGTVNGEKVEKRVNGAKTVIYLTDFEMKDTLRSMKLDFKKKFKLPGLMPGGSHCMLESVRRL